MEYCLYGDESCQHENDGIKSMALGCVWCPKSEKTSIANDLRKIKVDHGLSPYTCELKWTRVSNAKKDYYYAVYDYFISNDMLNYRVVIIPDKTILRHHAYQQIHSEWVYKMWYECIKHVVANDCTYDIYIDISEHDSYKRSHMLMDVLNNKFLRSGYRALAINKIQNVDSKQVEILQLADFLTGSICYGQRGLSENAVKKEIVTRMLSYLRMAYWRTTRSEDRKVSILVWEPKGSNG